MDVEEILARAKSGTERPDGWTVFPLLRRKVIWSILGWMFGTLMGVALLAIITPIVIPSNYLHGFTSIIFTTILLGIFLFTAVGSAVLLIADIKRLLHLDKHIIVITDKDFVKQENNKIIQVPLINVRYVTPRGRAPIDRSPEAVENVADARQIPGVGENALGFFVGRGLSPTGMNWRRKRMRTPTSLAFSDSRTDSEVTVVEDTTYGDPFFIAAVLKKYVASVEEHSTL